MKTHIIKGLSVNKVSVVAVIHNEEQYIGEAFTQLKPYVDDFVVIDQASTDKTVEIAQQYTEKVYLFPRVYYPYAYIHEGMCVANNDWILKCDPDERWDKSLLEYFTKVIQYDYDAIEFNMEWEGKQHSKHIRLFNRRKVIWSDSLNAEPYNREKLRILEVAPSAGVIRNLRGRNESLSRYRIEGAKRLMARYGDTKVFMYKNFVDYYKDILKGELY